MQMFEPFSALKRLQSIRANAFAWDLWEEMLNSTSSEDEDDNVFTHDIWKSIVKRNPNKFRPKDLQGVYLAWQLSSEKLFGAIYPAKHGEQVLQRNYSRQSPEEWWGASLQNCGKHLFDQRKKEGKHVFPRIVRSKTPKERPSRNRRSKLFNSPEWSKFLIEWRWAG